MFTKTHTSTTSRQAIMPFKRGKQVYQVHPGLIKYGRFYFFCFVCNGCWMMVFCQSCVFFFQGSFMKKTTNTLLITTYRPYIANMQQRLHSCCWLKSLVLFLPAWRSMSWSKLEISSQKSIHLSFPKHHPYPCLCIACFVCCCYCWSFPSVVIIVQYLRFSAWWENRSRTKGEERAMTTTTNLAFKCYNCGKAAKFMCSRCHVARYCDTECQRFHCKWCGKLPT